MKHLFHSYGLVGLFLLGLLAGCGSDYQVAPVSGVVTYKGEPLANAQVMFIPEAGGRPSSGITDEQGRYELSYTIDVKGAPIGPCKVRISTAIVLPDDTVAKERLPAKFHAESTLVREVTRNQNTFNFDLTD